EEDRALTVVAVEEVPLVGVAVRRSWVGDRLGGLVDRQVVVRAQHARSLWAAPRRGGPSRVWRRRLEPVELHDGRAVGARRTGRRTPLVARSGPGEQLADDIWRLGIAVVGPLGEIAVHGTQVLHLLLALHTFGDGD